MSKEYRITWRHEIHFDAESDEEAREMFDCIELGNLDEVVKEDEQVVSHGWVEVKSFECVSDDYRDVSWESNEDVSCKFCHVACKSGDAHLHQGGWVCGDCWDDRLRATA